MSLPTDKVTPDNEAQAVIEEAYGEPLWLFFYDLESENTKSLTPEEQDWLRSERVEIWYKLRYTFKCVPLNNSVYLIRGEYTLAKLEELRKIWIEEYHKHDFTANISIFPVKTTEEGYKSFKNMEFDFIQEWLGKIEKALTRGLESGKLGKKNVQAHTKKIQLLQNILHEDFDDTFPNWDLGQDTMGVVTDLLHQAQAAVGISNIIMP